MSLANPFALFWLGLIVPVVGFYILKVRLRRVPVSTILFWRQIYDEHQPRSLWQRLRHWLSLVAQVALILLLVGALADPFFDWETRQLRRIVLIVDNSASMNATDVSPSRLAAAKDEALRVIGGMRFRDELAIVAAGGLPRVACGFTSHGRTLSHAIEDVAATDNPTRVTEAIELARRLLGERQDDHQREIVVLTDVINTIPTELVSVARGPLHYAKDELTPNSGDSSEVVQKPGNHRDKLAGVKPELNVRRFGENTGNVGITQFQVRRSLIDPLGYEILAEVTNASDDAVECRLEIDLNEDVVDVVPLKLTPGQNWSQSFEKTSADGGHLTAKLDRADALAADNLARAVLPKREMMPMTLVSEGNLFIQKVFESNPLVGLTRVEPSGWKPTGSHIRQNVGDTKSDANSDSAHSLATVATSGITVLHRHVPEQLPNGSFLVIDPRGSCDLWQIGEPVQNPIVSQQDKDYSSSLLGHVRLDNVLMPEARQLKFVSDKGVKVLARSLAGDPLLAIIERPGLKVLLLTVNLDEGDLPLRTAFPILMMNALNWFTENRGELREALPTGAITEIELAALTASARRGSPDHAASLDRRSPTNNDTSAGDLRSEDGRGQETRAQRSSLSLIAPDGRRLALPMPAERLSLGPFYQCGIWRVVAPAIRDREDGTKLEESDTTLLELACNLADRSESDVRVPKSDEATPTVAVSVSWFGNRPVWFWLIAFAWLMMAVEWWAYQRRVIA